jgi:ATP-binding cassette subfamily B protein/subfamily B ATP-binding cassette protein MsbA
MRELESTLKLQRVRTRTLYRWLLGFGLPYRAAFVLFVGLMVLEILVGLLVPWPLKILVDNVLGGETLPVWAGALANIFSLEGGRIALLVAVCIAGLTIGLLSEFVSLGHTQLQVNIGQRMVLDLQRRLFAHLQKLSLRYHQNTGTGDAIYRLDSDAFCVDSIIMSGFFPLASALLTLGLMFAILFRLDPLLAMLSIAVVPLLFIVIHRYSARLSDRAERVKEMESGIFNLVHEVFSSIKLVKAFSREHYEQGRFLDQGSTALRARLNVTFQESLFSVTISSLTYLGTAVVLGVGGWHVLQGRLTVGELLVVVAYLGSVYGPLSSISHTIGNLQGSVASARRVYETLHLEPEIHDLPGALEAPRLRGHVRFDQVSFAYIDARLVLKQVDFEALPGQMVALVGLTGAGKTTLVSLIPRFYDPTAGSISIDGVDIRQMTLNSLRESISVVLQEPILFSSSIEDNIKYGKLDASHEEVAAAARAAQAHDFIELMPEQYASTLGEAGSQLSGGERQRISIARAILKDAPILILDEPTSALDSRAEAKVFEALRTLMKGRTTIVIAHRLSTIRDADRIIVLDGGGIVDAGRHEELLARNGLYRELCERLSLGVLPDPAQLDMVATD